MIVPCGLVEMDQELHGDLDPSSREVGVGDRRETSDRDVFGVFKNDGLTLSLHLEPSPSRERGGER